MNRIKGSTTCLILGLISGFEMSSRLIALVSIVSILGFIGVLSGEGVVVQQADLLESFFFLFTAMLCSGSLLLARVASQRNTRAAIRSKK